MKSAVDIAIVGGGPAGCAAAIHARQSGLSVLLIEAEAFPRHRPGETLHPGARSIFRQLGVEKEVDAAATARHRSILLNWAGRASREVFDSAGDGDPSGYQVSREKLDGLLLERARAIGVLVEQPRRAVGLLRVGRRTCGVETDDGPVESRSVIDASGTGNWLRRSCGLKFEFASPRLIARYGYCRTGPEPSFECPSMTGDGAGWQWVARVSKDTVAWVSLVFPHVASAAAKAKSLHGFPDIGRVRGADVTWRRLAHCAGSGLFVTGDAAFVVDPASSHGVLRAMMSGMMAAYQASAVLRGSVDPDQAAQLFRNWMAEWWERDTSLLSELYAKLDPAWARPLAGRGRCSNIQREGHPWPAL